MKYDCGDAVLILIFVLYWDVCIFFFNIKKSEFVLANYMYSSVQLSMLSLSMYWTIKTMLLVKQAPGFLVAMFCV